MPLAVLEAMAVGLPAVVTDVVGNRDAVRHGESGFLYAEGDAEAAALALVRLAEDNGLCRAMGRSARLHVLLHHDARRMTEQTAAIWREAASPYE
jgi:glycosyltransferase involved in cell wall biosynthesis